MVFLPLFKLISKLELNSVSMTDRFLVSGERKIHQDLVTPAQRHDKYLRKCLTDGAESQPNALSKAASCSHRRQTSEMMG